MKKSMSTSEEDNWKWIFYFYAKLLCYVQLEDKENTNSVLSQIMQKYYLKNALYPLFLKLQLVKAAEEEQS